MFQKRVDRVCDSPSVISNNTQVSQSSDELCQQLRTTHSDTSRSIFGFYLWRHFSCLICVGIPRLWVSIIRTRCNKWSEYAVYRRNTGNYYHVCTTVDSAGILYGARQVSAFEDSLSNLRLLLEVSAHTHYFPKEWSGKEGSRETVSAFMKLYPYSVVLWLLEALGIFLAPIQMCTSLASSSGKRHC